MHCAIHAAGRFHRTSGYNGASDIGNCHAGSIVGSGFAHGGARGGRALRARNGP